MPATDNFSRFQTQASDPATNAVLVSPNDSTDLTYVSRAVYVGTGGNMKVNGRFRNSFVHGCAFRYYFAD